MLPIRRLWLLVVILVLMLPVSAFAQTTGTSAAGAPALTPTIAVVMIVSLLAGFISHSIQSGSILGIATTPKAWLPEMTVLGTFLAGAVAYMTSAPGFVLTASTAFYAVAAGAAALGMGAVPGFATLAHMVIPGQRLAMRQLRSKTPPSGGSVSPTADTLPPPNKPPTPPPVAARRAIGLVFAIVAMVVLFGCPQAAAVAPPVIDCSARIVQDAIAGMTLEQIVADAGPACGADLLTVLTTVLASQDARVTASKAYIEAIAVKGALLPQPTGGK